VYLEQRTVVYPAKSAIDQVYFPLRGVVSLVLSSEEGDTVEVGMIGNEGLTGTPLVLGADRSQFEAVIQVSGDFMRMARNDFEQELNGGSVLRKLGQRFAQALTNQIAQSVLCNRIHSVEQRLCRWFLMTHDRAGANEIILTQQFVAQMLGVRRASVTDAAGILQKAGLITYSRGRLEIADRKGLEAGACECYRIIQQETWRLLQA
jgi:CRP-like cAMP-binding protein